MNDTRDLTQGNIARNLAIFAIPFFVSFFLNSLYSAIDLLFIGQFSDTYNIAAVSSGTTIIFAVNSVITGLATGGTVVIGQYFGAKNPNLPRVTRTFIIYMIAIALLSVTLTASLSSLIIKWMQIEESAVEVSVTYLLILSFSLPLYAGYLTISAILRGLGNSFAPFIFVLVAVATNIGLDALFVIVLKKGAVGAAVATVIGQGVGFLTSLIYLLFRKLPYKVERKLLFDMPIFKEILKCGLPIAIQDGLVVLSFAMILAFISTRGVDYTSAVGITDRVTSFGFVPLAAIGNAINTATAQNMGAGKIENVRKYLKYGLIYSVVAGLIFGSLCELIPQQLASIFAGNNTEAIEIATPYIRSTALDIFVCCLIFPINAVFIGSGKTVFAMSHNLATTFAVRVPFAFVMALAINAPMFVIGFAYPLSTVVSLIACLIYFKMNRWANTKSLSTNVELIE